VRSAVINVDCCRDSRGVGLSRLSAGAGAWNLVCCHDGDPGAG
jgi:hypothetical protein